MSSHVFTTHLDFGELSEQPLRVHYDYQPLEVRNLEHPGCEASIEICAVEWRNEDLTSDLADNDTLVDLCWEHQSERHAAPGREG